MASISHHAFQFQTRKNNWATLSARDYPEKIYHLELTTLNAIRVMPWNRQDISLPRKITAALWHACREFDRRNPHHKTPWRALRGEHQL